MLQTNTESPTIPKSKLITGLCIFVLGQLSPLLIWPVTQLPISTEWKTIISGIILFGLPELSIIAAAAVFGKEGFEWLKSKLYALLGKVAPAHHVSKTRYRIGLVLFIIPFIFGYIAPYIGNYFSFYIQNIRLFALTGDIMVITSLFILGGEFFDKLRSLFVHRSRAEFYKD